MNSWFANISVNLKLGLGFGLVLVLTGLLALTGWTSLGSLIDRSNWMGDIGQLNKDLTDLRIARLQYMIANGDDAAAANTQASWTPSASSSNTWSPPSPARPTSCCSRNWGRPSASTRYR